MQEAFLAVWRTAAAFVPERAKASTWILTLVHRRAVDLVRREERRRTEPLDEATARAGDRVGRGRRLAPVRARARAGRTRASCRTRSARRSSSPTTAASRSPSSQSGSASRSARSRAGCSPGSRGCASSSTTKRRRSMDDRIHELTAGYALDALDPDDHARFEEHLAACDRCREELAAFWQVAGALASRPTGRRRRPRCVSGSSARPGTSGRTSCRCGPAGRVPVLSSAAAVAAVAALALGLWAASLSSDLDDARGELASARATRTRRRTRPRNGEASLVVTPTGDAALVVRKLAPAPEGKDYQMWVFEDETPRPAGLFEEPGVAVARTAGRPAAAGRRHAGAGRRASTRRRARRSSARRDVALSSHPVTEVAPMPSVHSFA